MVYGLGYGAELAVALNQEGCEVTLAGKADSVAANLSSAVRRQYLMKKLDPDVDLAEMDLLNVRLLKRSQLVAVDDDGSVTLKKKSDEGEEEIKIQVDTLIISMGRRSNNALVEELKEKGIEAMAIGDAKTIREIAANVEDGNRAARGI